MRLRDAEYMTGVGEEKDRKMYRNSNGSVRIGKCIKNRMDL